MRNGIVDTARVPWTVEESRMEETMGEIDRRSALMIGLASAGTVLTVAGSATAQMYRPDEGRQVEPGVRVVDLAKREMMHGRDAVLPGYKQVAVRDVVFQPGVG
jgi:hypothetical protein